MGISVLPKEDLSFVIGDHSSPTSKSLLYVSNPGTEAGMYTIEHLLMRDRESKGDLESVFRERQKDLFQYQSERIFTQKDHLFDSRPVMSD